MARKSKAKSADATTKKAPTKRKKSVRKDPAAKASVRKKKAAPVGANGKIFARAMKLLGQIKGL